MLVSTRVPGPPLDQFVELLWLYEHAVPHPRERLLPTGSMELVFVLSSPRAESLVAGAYSQFAVLDTSEPASVLGVHFKPGGAFPFVRMPAGELHNIDVSLDDLWGAAAAREVHARLVAAPTPDAKFALLERALLRQATTLERRGAVPWAVRELTRARKVGEVTEAIGMSGRGFIEAFRRETGYTPKVFARVQRFQRLLRRVHGCEDVDWPDVALACGYYDQPHLIRDFRAFAGLTPSEYLAARTDHLNHVPMP
jgi:AraC-like DNA-binding protein